MTDAGLLRLEEVFLNSMTPPEQLLYDGWLVRFARDDAKRARSVNVLAPSRMPLEGKLDYCTMLYGEKQMTPLYRITSIADNGGLDELLATRGYRRFDESIVMMADLEAGAGAEPQMLRFEAVDADGFTRISAELQGWGEDFRAAVARRLRFTPLPQHRLVTYDGDDVIAAAMSIREDDWVGLFNVHVDASRRRQGIGRALCAYLMEQGRLWGSARAWLAVEADNEPAIGLYRRLGFSEAYRYWYREAPSI
jgi:ribosomal protein S18 acetylase RimI-like enzyme